MIERIKKMIIKEFIQVFRDKRLKAIVFVTPVIQLMAFGYAVSTDVNHIKAALYDLDRSFESREFQRRLEGSGYFDVKYFPDSPGEIQRLLDSGMVTAAITIDRDFSKDLKKGKAASIQVVADGTDSNTAIVALDYTNRILAQFSKDLSGERTREPVNLNTRAWYNPDLRSRTYNVPGVIAIVIMLTCLLLTSMSIVREREIGTIEQLMVTPLKPIELILGKTLPFAIMGFFDMALTTAVGTLWFNIPIHGSMLFLVASTAVYLLSALGTGLFISTVSRTQQQALMATFIFYLPAVLLSGFMFPIVNMPKAIQYITYINPLRYFLVIIRGIFLKGSGIAVLWPEVFSMLVLGVAVILVSSLRFKKRLG